MTLPAAGNARHATATGPLPAHTRVVVVGSGFSGIGTAVALRRRGITDFVVLERAGSLGGTWRDNAYPGAACDVPSHLYSFCRSWYRDAQGRNFTLWPTHTVTFLRQMRRFDADAYELRTARRAAVPAV